MMSNFVKGMAAGMLHLHREGLVHRDLAARNVLLGAGYQVKISDFGMSRIVNQEDTSNKTSSDSGPLKWMAPELILTRTYSTQSDVWSFAVTVWEIVSRQNPYPNLDPVQTAIQVTRNGLRLPIPQNCPIVLVEIMNACFQDRPENRPDLGSISKHLTDAEPMKWLPASSARSQPIIGTENNNWF